MFLIVIGLYGLKESGAAGRSKLAETLNSMGYSYNEYDPAVWIKRATADNGNAYYKYILVFVDDVLHLAKGTQ